MDRDPGDFPAPTPTRAVADMSDAEFDAWMESIPPAPGIGSIDDYADDDDASIAEFEAGGGVPHAIVVEWLKTWGAPDYLPFWDWYAARNG